MTKGDKDYYVCEKCSMVFHKLRIAEYCEKRCREGKECQGKMIRHCVKL